MTTETAAKPTPKLIDFQFSRKQYTALMTLLKPCIEMIFELLYGGAKGGGKTVFLTRFAFLYAKMLIQEYGLKPQADLRQIPVVGFLGRKIGKDFNSTTMLTWKREIPGEAYELRLLEGKVPVIVIENRIALLYGGMDNTDTVKKFNSAELMFYCVDQAEECEEQDIAMLRGTLRLQLKDPITGRPRPPQLGYKGLLSANPAPCWLKAAFVVKRTAQPGTAFIPALWTDNPFLPTNYGETLRKAYQFNPALLNAYMSGSWDDLESAFTIIPLKHVEQCIDNRTVRKLVVKRITVCDVAGEGDGEEEDNRANENDEAVIANFENEELKPDWEIFRHATPMDTAGRIISHAMKNGSNLICIDKVGVGAGVYSRVDEVISEWNEKQPDDKKIDVYGYDGRISPPGPRPHERTNDTPPSIEQQTYANWKTYSWFKASDIFRERNANILNDAELVRQLSGVTYHFTSNGKMIVDKKTKLRKILGCSPDRADVVIMGLEALDRARPILVRDRWKDDDTRNRKHRLSADAA